MFRLLSGIRPALLRSFISPVPASLVSPAFSPPRFRSTSVSSNVPPSFRHQAGFVTLIHISGSGRTQPGVLPPPGFRSTSPIALPFRRPFTDGKEWRAPFLDGKGRLAEGRTRAQVKEIKREYEDSKMIREDNKKNDNEEKEEKKKRRTKRKEREKEWRKNEEERRENEKEWRENEKERRENENEKPSQVSAQSVINYGALPCLLNLLTHNHKKSIEKEACWTKEQIQSVIDSGIIPPLVYLLQNAEFKIKKKAAWAISNATFGGTDDQIKFLVSQGCIKPLCDLLFCPDPIIVTVCLEGLENILKVGEADKCLGHSPSNLFGQAIVEADGLHKLINLLWHVDNDIYEKALKLIATYWFGGNDHPSG